MAVRRTVYLAVGAHVLGSESTCIVRWTVRKKADLCPALLCVCLPGAARGCFLCCQYAQ